MRALTPVTLAVFLGTAAVVAIPGDSQAMNTPKTDIAQQAPSPGPTRRPTPRTPSPSPSPSPTPRIQQIPNVLG